MLIILYKFVVGSFSNNSISHFYINIMHNYWTPYKLYINMQNISDHILRHGFMCFVQISVSVELLIIYFTVNMKTGFTVQIYSCHVVIFNSCAVKRLIPSEARCVIS